MSAARGAVALSPQEALARDVILQRAAARRHAPRRVTRHVRAALLLRRLAERLDPGEATGTGATSAPAPHPARGAARPWTAERRRAPHRHS